MDKKTLNFFEMTYTTNDLMQANLTRLEPYPQLTKDAALLNTTLGTTGGAMKEECPDGGYSQNGFRCAPRQRVSDADQ